MNVAQLPADGAGQSRARLKADPVPVLEALDCLRVAVTLYDPHERLIYLNQHYNYLFRALPPAAKLIGHSYEEIVRLELQSGLIAPDSYPDGEEAFVAARRAQFFLDDYTPRNMHLADGRLIEIKVRQSSDGNWIALWSDVTAAHNAFDRLTTAVELSADAFAMWDRDDKLVMCNPAFAQMHGRRNGDSLQGRTFTDLMTQAVRKGLVTLDDKADAWLERRFAAHQAQAGAFTLTLASGKAYLVRDRVTGDGGRATIYTDITDHRRTEAAFVEQKTALVEAQRALDKTKARAREQANYLADLNKRLDHAEEGVVQAKTTFLRTMSHELKTPLNAIIGFSDLLKSAPDRFSPEQVGEYAGLIHTAGHNLLRMLNQILDLTKIAAGRFPLNCMKLTVSCILEDGLDAIRERAEAKAITVSVDPCPADLAVDADESALATMIRHLTENAVNAMPEGGALRLSASRCASAVRIMVADNGPGVKAEDLERILEPFEQVGTGIAGYAHGGGLGLPLVKALAELHGGTLSIESVCGEGFTATLELPGA